MSLSEFPPLHGQYVGNSYVPERGSFDITTFGILSGREVMDEIEEKTFKEIDAEEAVKCLRRCFQVLNPGNHSAKRCPEHGSISFIHCKHAIGLGRKYRHLRKVMEERARLELLKDCLFRIKLATSFVNDLESLVLAEYRTLYAISHDCSKDVHISKLCCLNALCEDLRTQVGHWNCIKQKLHTNRWLQPVLGTLYFQLENVKVTLNQLRDKAIYWLEKLILTGLQVFAHGDVENVTHEMIWNITRGLEDFNSVLKGITNTSSTSKSLVSSSKLVQTSGVSPFDPTLSNSYADVGERIRAIPFTRVLNILANERSKYAAIEAHRFFTTNDDFIKVLYSGKLPDFVWTDETKSSLERPDRDTSDYHTATGSMTSLSAAVLKVGSIKAPDLSNLISPLVDVSRKEHSFAEHFLLIVCNSTNLLRRSDNQQKSRRPLKASQSVSFGRPPRGQHSETPVLSRNDSLRKSVSWGDSADSSIRSQLISRYMDMYWNNFGSNLQMIFYELNWGKQKTMHQSEIGSLLICNTTVIALIKHMMEHVCLKGPMFNLLKLPSNSAWEPGVPPTVSELSDLFPPGSVTPMLSAAKKCFHAAAYGAWDNCMSNAIASQISDKCYPCPLVNGEYSTHTGMLLRDTYQPMLNLLREQLAECSESIKGAITSLSKSQPDIRQVVALTTRLAATSGVAYQWCSVKTRQFLTSFSVSNFLLISQTDLKVLIDEAQSSLYQIQMFSKAIGQRSGDDFNTAALETAVKQLSTFCNNLQSLPGTTMKMFSKNCFSAAYDYFKDTMPTGKVWRKKQEGELPRDYNVYIEHVLETVLEPVLEGVNKLKQTTQLGVVSMAVVAVCDAWIAFIMKEKIKFSYVGAHQLGLDVTFMKSWLRQCISNEAVRLTILDLGILKALNGAVLLLKRQNGKRSSSRFQDSVREDSTDSVSGNDISVQGESSIHEIENDISHVGNPDDWLALRVQGGRSWKISSCFTHDACEG